MKKIISVLVLLGGIFLLGGCFDSNKLENATIYTTVYPVQYLVERLYGNHATVNSIYPDGAKLSEYTLTDKQIKTYSKADILVYNGLTEEKQISKQFINENKNIKIIDVAYGLKYYESQEELWLSPNNYLMLANNIKTNLITLVNNKYAQTEIQQKYDELEEELSLMDAELRNLGIQAKSTNKETIVVSKNMFKYLENYGFKVISIEDAEKNETMDTIKKNFKNKTYKMLFITNIEEETEYIKELKNQNLVYTVNSMETLSTENRNNNDNYMTITKDFINELRNLILD